jgi:hypothetical protein
MMPVIAAAFGKGVAVCSFGSGIEHQGTASVTGHAVAFKIGNMPCERCRPKFVAAVPDDTRFDDDAAIVSA